MNTNVILYQTDDDQNDKSGKSGLGRETERDASVSVIEQIVSTATLTTGDYDTDSS